MYKKNDYNECVFFYLHIYKIVQQSREEDDFCSCSSDVLDSTSSSTNLEGEELSRGIVSYWAVSSLCRSAIARFFEWLRSFLIASNSFALSLKSIKVC